MAQLIDGRKIAHELMETIRIEIAKYPGRKPGLAFCLIGDDPASKSYVRSKKKGCAITGISSTSLEFPSSLSESELIAQIEILNRDPDIDGILVQLPLPSHMRTKEILSAIDPTKDVDGFHPLNVGKMLLGDDSALVSCTPQGILMLLEKSQIPVEGKHVVIIGRSNIVGKPLAGLLMQRKKGCNATVTVCHSHTQGLAKLASSADILVAALGKPLFIREEMIKPGATVIDVGIHRLDGNIVGDVDFASALRVASYITPVPGGVGPMTVAMLLHNTLRSYLAKHA